MSAMVRRALSWCALSTLVVASMSVPSDAATEPGTPSGVTVRPGSSSAVITWNAAPRATHYRVCLLTTKTQKKCGYVSEQLTTPHFTATGLTKRSGTDYYARVYAYRGSERTGSSLTGFELTTAVKPAATTGITQTVTSSTLTIRWTAAKNAQQYVVCLSSSQTGTRCTRTSPRSADLTATFTGLSPTAGGDWFYRVHAHNDTGYSRSAQQRADLPVGSVPGVTASRGESGVLEASWQPATNAETYELQLATNAKMTSGLRRYTVSTTSVSPAELPIGTTYYYRVRGINGVQKGAFSTVAGLRLPSTPFNAYVLTYNLCGQDKCVSRANKMKRWSTRRAYAGRIARDSGADIIATQESHDEDTRFGRELPGFGLAAYFSAKSLFYDKRKYDVLRSGTITLSRSQKKYAVWAEFREVSSRTTFIVVDAHLQPFKGRTNDDLRSAQTKVLLSAVKAANPAKLPVVYAGDFNSNKSNADQRRYKGGYDAPRKVFLAAGIPDTFSGTANPIHADFNSANQAINPPLRHSDHVDHIYADASIEVRSWRVMVDLDGSRYRTPFATDHNPIRTILTVPGR